VFLVIDHWNGAHFNQVEDYGISWARSWVTGTVIGRAGPTVINRVAINRSIINRVAIQRTVTSRVER
jgi:hypothetical protein